MSLLSHLENRRKPGATFLVCGVMTGTSCDGVDLALCRFRSSATTTAAAGQQKDEDDSPFELVNFSTAPYPSEVLALVKKLLSSSSESGQQQQAVTLSTACELNTQYSKQIGLLINRFLSSSLSATERGAADEVVIACHGQTIWHNSGSSTLQLGDGEVLAHSTGRVCVTNFRAADVACGGTGAPLVPFLDRKLAVTIAERFQQQKLQQQQKGTTALRPCLVVMQNFGGIGNASVVSVSAVGEGGRQSAQLAAAFDTGPANVVLNELCSSLSDPAGVIVQCLASSAKRTSSSAADVDLLEHFRAVFPPEAFRSVDSLPSYDRDGLFSSLGDVDEKLLATWLSHPYFDVLLKKKEPSLAFADLRGRSTGREQFGSVFVSKILADAFSAQDDGVSLCPREVVKTFCSLCATALQFTVESVALHVEASIVAAASSGQKDVLLCCSGGGAAHPLMMKRLADRLGPAGVSVHRLSEFVSFSTSPQPFSFDDAKEAVAFALLGHEKLCALANPELAMREGTNEPAATGANRKCFLGQVSAPF